MVSAAVAVVSVVAEHREDGEMKTCAQTFLNEQEQQQINRAVQDAEKQTSGEIVPMVVSRSGRYHEAVITCALFLSVPISLIGTFLVGNLLWIGPYNLWLFLLWVCATTLITHYIARHSEILSSFFIQERYAQEEVERAALAAFYSHGLYKTRDHNGILLYVSVLEKKVWILADSAINEQVEQATWDEVMEKLVQGIKNREQCQAICDAVGRIGEILRQHFPYTKDDEDELHNLIIE